VTNLLLLIQSISILNIKYIELSRNPCEFDVLVFLSLTKLSKVPGKSEGLKMMLKVMAGDTIEISAKNHQKKPQICGFFYECIRC